MRMPPQASDPFAAIRAALNAGAEITTSDQTYPLRLDTGREARMGIPEVVFAPGKSAAQIAAAVRGLLNTAGRAIVSRVGAADLVALRAGFPGATVTCGEGMRTAIVTTEQHVPRVAGGRVGIVT